MFFVHGLDMHTRSETRFLKAGKPIERVHCVIRKFGRQSPPTVRLLCASSPLHTRRGRATRKGKHVTFARRNGKWGCTESSCLPTRGDLLSQLALHHVSAGGAPTLRKPRPFLPCPLPIPPLRFPSLPPSSVCHCRGCVSFLGAVHHFPVLSCSS